MSIVQPSVWMAISAMPDGVVFSTTYEMIMSSTESEALGPSSTLQSSGESFTDLPTGNDFKVRGALVTLEVITRCLSIRLEVSALFMREDLRVHEGRSAEEVGEVSTKVFCNNP